MKIVRTLVSVCALVAPALACGSSGQVVDHPVTLTSDQCSANRVACTSSEACCSGWCANGVCATRQP